MKEAEMERTNMRGGEFLLFLSASSSWAMTKIVQLCATEYVAAEHGRAGKRGLGNMTFST